jgi:hypothetical protein
MSSLSELCRQTGTKPADWALVDGPETGHGIDYWYEHVVTAELVYVNNDQGHVTVERACNTPPSP